MFQLIHLFGYIGNFAFFPLTVYLDDPKTVRWLFLLKLVVKDSVDKFQMRNLCISPVSNMYTLLNFQKSQIAKIIKIFPRLFWL